MTGLSSDAEGLASGEFALRGFRARNPALWIAWTLLREVGRADPGFGPVGGPLRRGLVGLLFAVGVLTRFTVAIALRSLLHARAASAARAAAHGASATGFRASAMSE